MTVCYCKGMANKPEPTAKAEDNNNNHSKPRKINLSELKGTVSPRGRKPYTDEALVQYLTEMVQDGEGFGLDAPYEVTDDMRKGTPRGVKAQNRERAKWRNRIVSVWTSTLGRDKGEITVGWTSEHEVTVSLRNKA